MLSLQFIFQSFITAYCLYAAIAVYWSGEKGLTGVTRSEIKFMRWLPVTYATRCLLQIVSLSLWHVLLKKQAQEKEKMYLALVVSV